MSRLVPRIAQVASRLASRSPSCLSCTSPSPTIANPITKSVTGSPDTDRLRRKVPGSRTHRRPRDPLHGTNSVAHRVPTSRKPKRVAELDPKLQYGNTDDQNGAYFRDEDDNWTIGVQGNAGFVHQRCADRSRPCCADPDCRRHPYHVDSLVVAVDGACPSNGRDADRSSAAVYFGSDIQVDTWVGHRNNVAFRIPDVPGFSHTNQRAELHAGIAGVKAAERFVRRGGQWRCDSKVRAQVCRTRVLVIKSDSEYLVRGATDWMENWVAAGWRTAHRKPVSNKDLWKALREQCLKLTRLGCDVYFWHVAREMNKEADALANQALEPELDAEVDDLTVPATERRVPFD